MSLGFESFSSFLIDRFTQSLPGSGAQLQMAPLDRPPESLLIPDLPDAKMSSVILLCFPEQNLPQLVLIERNTYPGIHSGQMGLPGGKQDDNDPNLEHTALRETHEELGIEREQIQLIGKLTPLYIPVSKFLVHPFVGLMKEKPEFRPDPREVSGYITLNLHDLTNEKLKKLSKVSVGNGFTKTVPSYVVSDKVVWGATAMILGEFSELIQPFFLQHSKTNLF